MNKALRQNKLGFWEIAAKPTQAELQRYYADSYYQKELGSYQLQYSAAELQQFESRLQIRYAVIDRIRDGGSAGSLLDVGCGEGFTLAFFRAHGWSIQGIDFSAAGVESQNPHCRDAFLAGDIFDLLNHAMDSGSTYDVVWLQNVLEHVLEPLDLLRSLRKLVTPDGIAVITVPNDCSIVQRAALASGHIDREFWVAPPDHLSYFDSETLAQAASAMGWDCLEMLADFPVDWFLFHPGSNFVRDRSQGKAAHLARVEIENLIHTRPVEDAIRFWSAAARLGLGRNITAFLRPA